MRRRHFLMAGLAASVLPAYAADDGPAGIARAFARKTNFNGVILAGTGDRVLFSEAYGLADFATQRPMTTQTG